MHTVCGASLFAAGGTWRGFGYLRPEEVNAEYDRALTAAYVANTGVIPPSRHDLDPELVDQFQFKIKNARGLETLARCRAS